MTTLVMCSVRDAVADTFGRPFFVQSVAVAHRSFADEVNRPVQHGQGDSLLQDHPADFELYQLGTFDDQTGRVHMLDLPELVVRGSSVVKAREA
nr:MAG: nonstructural protein [Microvirus sp.]